MAEPQGRRGLWLGAAALGLLLLYPTPRTAPLQPGERVDLEELEKTVEQLRGLLRQAQEQLDELQSQLDQAMQGLRRVNDDVRALEQQLADLKATKDELLRQIDDAQQTVEALQQEIAQLDQDLSQAAQDGVATSDEIKQLRQDIEAIQDLVASLDGHIQAMRATIDQLQGEIDALRTTNDQLKADLAALQAALKAANAQIAELQRTIDALNATVAQLQHQVAKLGMVVEWLNYEARARDQDLPVISGHFQSVYAPSVYYMPPRTLSWQGAGTKLSSLPGELIVVLAKGLRSNKPYVFTGKVGATGYVACSERYLCCDGWPCTACHTDTATVKAWLEVVDASGKVLKSSSEITGSDEKVHPGGWVMNGALASTGLREVSVEIPAGVNLTLRLHAKLEGWAYRFSSKSSLASARNSEALAPLYFDKELAFYGSSLATLEQNAGVVVGRLARAQDAPPDAELSAKARTARVVAANGIQAGLLVLPFSQQVKLAWTAQSSSAPNAWPVVGWCLFGTDGQRVLIYAHAEKDLPASAATWSGEMTLNLPSGAFALVAFAGSCGAGMQCEGVGARMEVAASYAFYGGLAAA